MNPYVKSLRPLKDHVLEIVFENGECRIFDAKPYLQRGVFVRLQNPAAFQAARVVAGSVEWSGELDLSYDTSTWKVSQGKAGIRDESRMRGNSLYC